MIYTVQQVIERKEELLNSEVNLKGVVLTFWNDELDDTHEVYDDFFISQDLESYKKKDRCIFLNHPLLEVEFRKHKVAGRAGGINGGGLSNACEATGLLRVGQEPFILELKELSKIVVRNAYGKAVPIL